MTLTRDAAGQAAQEQQLAHAVALRRDLHRHPEVMFNEHRTAAVVRGELDALGIPWKPCAGTGTVAVISGTRAPVAGAPRIALRADLDALPLTESTGLPYASVHAGVMHACGHDGHTASLLAAAAALKARADELPAPVTLLFQPAEEGGHGGKMMVEAGAVDAVDEVYAWHNWPPFPLGTARVAPGPMMAANGEWTAVITGRGGHAAQPHQCIDPIVTGAHFVTMAQQIVSREVPPGEAAVVTVTCFHGGTADNIIPDAVEMIGTVRAATTTLRDHLATRVQAVLNAACAASGATPTFKYVPCYPATVNNPACAARAAAALADLLGEAAVSAVGMPLMAAEDFGYFTSAKPGAFILLGAGRPGQAFEPCHSPRFDFNDELIPVAVRLCLRLAGLPA